MFIEDLICKLYLTPGVNSYDSQMIVSLSDQIYKGLGFTEKQSLLAIKLLKRYTGIVSGIVRTDVTSFLGNPTFKLGIRKINNNKRVSIVDHATWKRAIKVEFPFNEERVTAIRKNRDLLNLAVWDPEEKAWMFGLSEMSILFLSDMIFNDGFEVDDEFEKYARQVKNIVDNIESYVPMLHLIDGVPKYVNVPATVPSLASDSILSAVFEARKSGIFTWDESINQFLDHSDLDPVVKSFLTSDKDSSLEVDSAKEPVQCLADLVKYMQPCLFIIPGGSELVKTKLIYNFLKEQGYKEEEMSVLFRLPSETGKEFNNFVKNSGLNNPITDATKFVFVSIKLPKPVVKSKMKFQCVISLGRSNVHYTIREFFKNRQNLIYYCEKSKQKEFNFGNL